MRYGSLLRKLVGPSGCCAGKSNSEGHPSVAGLGDGPVPVDQGKCCDQSASFNMAGFSEDVRYHRQRDHQAKVLAVPRSLSCS